MALSTLSGVCRRSLRSGLSLNYSLTAVRSTVPMSSTAHEEMKKFWAKNQKLNRPSSPWTVYWPHLPMMTSLTHRATGISMGVMFYIIATDLLLAPGDFPSYIELVKNMNISPVIMFSAKSIMAFPLIYHYLNGIRHLSWDYSGKGFEMKTQYKTGWTIMSSAILLSLGVATISYW